MNAHTGVTTIGGGLLREINRKVLVGLLTYLVTGVGSMTVGVLGAVTTPYGEDLQEWLHPTRATVQGQVVSNGIPVEAIVLRDQGERERTDSGGVFLLDHVSADRHCLDVLQFDSQQKARLVYSKGFVVPRGEDLWRIDPIDLANAVPISTDTGTGCGAGEAPQLAHGADPLPRLMAWSGGGIARAAPNRALAAAVVAGQTSGCPTPTSSGVVNTPTASSTAEFALAYQATPHTSGASCVRVWLAADPDLLAHVEQVTYELGPSFNPSVVTRYSWEDRFLLTFVSPAPFTLTARVYFDDGRQDVELEQIISF